MAGAEATRLEKRLVQGGCSWSRGLIGAGAGERAGASMAGTEAGLVQRLVEQGLEQGLEL